jgi:hypothetical protein
MAVRLNALKSAKNQKGMLRSKVYIDRVAENSRACCLNKVFFSRMLEALARIDAKIANISHAEPML